MSTEQDSRSANSATAQRIGSGQIVKRGCQASSSLLCSPPFALLPSVHTSFLLSFRAQLTLLHSLRSTVCWGTENHFTACFHVRMRYSGGEGGRHASSLSSARNSGPRCLNSTAIEHKITCAPNKEKRKWTQAPCFSRTFAKHLCISLQKADE